MSETVPMRSSNPALSDKVFKREIEATRAGWAAPDSLRRPASPDMPPRPPVDDTVSPWSSPVPPAPPITADETMTVGGVVSASALLITIVLVSGWFGWNQVESSPLRIEVPGWLLLAALGGLGVAVLTIFKPKLARFTGPLYAVIEGLLLGAISHLYEFSYDGIVAQAVGLTVGVFCVMLFLYATRIIKVTEKLRMGIIAATGAVMLVYLVSMVLRLFGADVPFIHDGGPLGIVFSLVVVVIASLNLVLDFAFLERGSQAGAPKYMAWFAAFGLLVTLVWLYLELLRLLGQLRER
ncbi:hypothetical protein BH18ACT4_BH18ACT4_00230 [soil metagenome]